MTSMLTISAKGLDPEVKYRGLGTVFSFRDDQNQKEVSPDFLIETLNGEVIKETKPNLKLFKEICQKTIKASTALLVLTFPLMTQTAFAASPIDPGMLEGDMFLPADIWEIGMWLIGICAAASTVLSMILLQLAGSWRMLGKKKAVEATQWTTEILKGIMQVLLAPVIIVTLALLVYLLFGNFDWFVKPF